MSKNPPTDLYIDFKYKVLAVSWKISSLVMSVQLISSSLNATLTGNSVCNGKVEVYQGLKYANIPGRWQAPEPVDKYPDGTIVDCTKQGVQSPQFCQTGNEYWFAIPEKQKIPQKYEESEFECLSLKIVRPSNINKGELLPVAIFVHGGGNLSGTAYNPVLDPSRLVEYSIAINKPIICINTQYRLGKIGFRGFNGKGNWALKDLETTAHWVKDHIRDFGGDPKNITMYGESAGSIDLHALSLHDPNFNEVVSKIGFISGSVTNVSFSTLEKEKSATALDKERLKTDDLVHVDVKKLIEGSSLLETPVEDDGYFPQRLDRLKLPNYDAVLFITCNKEEKVFPRAEDYVGSDEVKRLDETEIGRSIKKIYSISGSELSDWNAIRRARADLLFSAPMYEMYENIAGKTRAFYMLYDHDNPYDKSFGAHHSLPLLMLFRNYEMNDEYVQYSNDLRTRLICFFHNEDPWDPKFCLNYTNHGIRKVSMDHLDEVRNIEAYRFLNESDSGEINHLLSSLMPGAA